MIRRIKEPRRLLDTGDGGTMILQDAGDTIWHTWRPQHEQSFNPQIPHIYLADGFIGLFNLLNLTVYVMHQQIEHSVIVRSTHTVFLCFVFISKQTATCATYTINWLVFITEMKSVYSAVRTGALNIAVCAASLNV
jgi:hypothetical protein